MVQNPDALHSHHQKRCQLFIYFATTPSSSHDSDKETTIEVEIAQQMKESTSPRTFIKTNSN